MVRTKDEIGIREVTGLMGGNGTLGFQDFMKADDAPGHGRVFARVTIPPGCSIGYHKHEGEFETYFILEGEAVVNDNGTEYTLHPGDMEQCVSGNSHSIENRTDKELAIIALIMKDLG